MRTYSVQIDDFDAPAGTQVLAIDNPAGSGCAAIVRCVKNAHTNSTTTAIYRVRRFDAVTTGGTALSLEPGDASPRVMRHDALDVPPSFEAKTGSFTPSGTQTFDEAFTVVGWGRSEEVCYEFGALTIRPGQSVVFEVVGVDGATTSLAMELDEEDAVPAINLPAADFARLVGESFSGSGSLDTEAWTVAVANDGSASISDGELVATTGVVTDGEVVVSSKRVARYLTGAVHEFVCALRLGDTGAAGNVRTWGAFTADGDDGYAFVLDGTTLGVMSRKAGVDTVIPQTAWDLDSFVVDTEIREWSIRYSHNRAEFFVDGVRRHTLGEDTLAPLVADRDFGVRFENVNSGGLASARTLGVVTAAIRRHGPLHGAVGYRHFNGTAQSVLLKAGAGTLSAVLVTKAGTGGSSIVVYDGLDNAGDVILDINGDALASLPCGRDGVEFRRGLYVVASSNSGKSTIFFD